MFVKFSTRKNAVVYECDEVVVKPAKGGGFRTTMYGNVSKGGWKWAYDGGRKYDRPGLPVKIVG